MAYGIRVGVPSPTYTNLIVEAASQAAEDAAFAAGARMVIRTDLLGQTTTTLAGTTTTAAGTTTTAAGTTTTAAGTTTTAAGTTTTAAGTTTTAAGTTTTTVAGTTTTTAAGTTTTTTTVAGTTTTTTTSAPGTTYANGFSDAGTLSDFARVGTWAIAGGKLTPTGDGAMHSARYPGIVTANGVIEVEATPGPNTDYMSLVARYTDDNHLVILNMTVGTNAWTIYEFLDGNLTQRATGLHTFAGEMTRVRLEIVGAFATLYLNGVGVGSGTLSQITGPGIWGVRASAANLTSDAQFDNLLISNDYTATGTTTTTTTAGPPVTYRNWFSDPATLSDFNTIGSWEISGGLAHTIGSSAALLNGSHRAIYPGISTANGVIETSITATADTDYVSFLVHRQDDDNFVLVNIDIKTNGGQTDVREYTAGALSAPLAGATATPFTPGVARTVRVEVTGGGANLNYFFDGVPTGAVTIPTSARRQAGTFAVRASQTATGTTFDKLLISTDNTATLGTEPTTTTTSTTTTTTTTLAGTTTTTTASGTTTTTTTTAPAAYRNPFTDSGTLSDFTTTGTWGISGGKLNVTGNTGAWQWARRGALSTANGVIETKITRGANTDYASLVARYVDDNNFVLINLDRVGTTWSIFEHYNGTDTELNASAPGFTLGAGDTIRLEFSGPTLTLKRNGATLGTGTVAHLTGAGTCAVRAYAASVATDTSFDDLLISNNPADTY
jgi:hypothetical protein